MTAPTKLPAAKAKPAAKQRAKATWTVYEQHANVEVLRRNSDADITDVLAADVTVLIQVDTNVVARTAADACWHIAETTLKGAATSSDPPMLTASRNGTQHGLNEPRPYALKPTVERVK